MSEVKLVNLSKNFDGKNVLDNINLTIEEGQLVSLLGPSGCGKSTTLKLIAGLINPDGGDILFNNNSIINIPTEKRDAVIVFQDYLLFPHMNVYDNIDFGLKMRKENKNIRKEKVNKIIELVKLNGYEKKYPSELSGGQKQRVAIARSLVINPKVLLLDEPFSNLDIRLRDDMREFVLDIQKKLNITTILVTHDKEEALIMSDKVAIMLDGKIKQFGTPNDIYERPVSIDVANFFGEKNYIKGKIENNVLKTDFGKFEVNYNENNNVNVMVSPERISIYSLDHESNVIGTVNKKRYAGDRIYYNVDVKNNNLKISSVNNTYNIGARVKIEIDFENASYFSL
jgi:ABC-type Fe3+/spermidine/putrescine transport system ATPase subunit